MSAQPIAVTGPVPRVRPVPHRPRTATAWHSPKPFHAPPTLHERVVVLRSAEQNVPFEEDLPVVPSNAPHALARSLALAVIEVTNGSRSVSQLARLLSPGVLEHLRERAAVNAWSPLRDSRGRPLLRKLVVNQFDQYVEVAAVVHDTVRTRAVAMRLDPHRGVWRVTALELG